MLTEKRCRRMNTQLLLEEKHVLLKNELDEKLQKKHALELELSNQYQELKRLETSLERQVFKTVREE
jgi:ABC-type phosphate transport system auxiliary subunit